MSYDYQRRTTTNRGRRPLYAPSPPPSRSGSSSHSLFGYWVPVVITGTLAIGGLAAWIWSERQDHDEDDYPQEKPPRPPTGVGGEYPTQGSQSYPGPRPPQSGQEGGYQGGQQSSAPPPPVGGEAASYYNTETRSRSTAEVVEQQQQQEDGTWYGRMTGAIRRTPSPQQFFDSASKGVTASMAAAGAALGSIMEDSDEHYEEDPRRASRGGERRVDRREDREGFSDHERWSEEADERLRVSGVEAESERRADTARSLRDGRGKGRAKKVVAVVVSADTNADVEEEENAAYRTEHASILSHLPAHHNPDTTDLFVLIYSPTLQALPSATTTYTQASTTPPHAAESAYSPTSTPAITPGSELPSLSPRLDPTPSKPPQSAQFTALYNQALTLVTSPTQILPFTTPAGYIHILRHLAPQLVYISDILSGDRGESIAGLKGWVGHTILVAGDEGHGGLADTETETEDEGGREGKWYEDSAFVGLGKEVEVVDAGRVGEDWGRRVGGRE